MLILNIDWGGALNLIAFSFSMVFLLLVVIVFALNIFGKIFMYIEKNKVETDNLNKKST
jgi:hydrogenase-4 membrane subunit HyfE